MKLLLTYFIKALGMAYHVSLYFVTLKLIFEFKCVIVFWQVLFFLFQEFVIQG